VAKAIDLGVDSVIDVLKNLYNLDGEEHGDEYKIHCPNPAHVDRDPSTDVNLITGYWNCLACGVGGDLAALGAKVLDLPTQSVIDMLKPRSPEALLAMVQRKLASVKMPRASGKRRAVKLPGPYEAGPFDELLARDFTQETIDKWGIRYCPVQTLTGSKGDFTIRNSIAIPIRDENGHLLAWCYRTTDSSPSWQPRYLYTPDFPISEVWFGMQHNHPSNVRHVAVAEGALDAAWIDQCGFPCLALLGSTMGDRKIKRLQSYDSVTMFADRDNSGAQWIKRIGNQLGSAMPLRVVLYDKRITRTYVDDNNPDHKKRKLDPQMMMPIDIELSMAKAVSWSSFVLRSVS
jgi:5S rRNA maturation endonuclease (ribonuclease M5)